MFSLLTHPLRLLFKQNNHSLDRRSPAQLAKLGESAAATYLGKHGCKIIARNFRCAAGEIDIIARHGQTLVFVEVKTRAFDPHAVQQGDMDLLDSPSLDTHPTPESQVNPGKQSRIVSAARTYLTRYGVTPPVRFDVIGIVWPHGRPPIIRHHPAAFQPA